MTCARLLMLGLILAGFSACSAKQPAIRVEVLDPYTGCGTPVRPEFPRMTMAVDPEYAGVELRAPQNVEALILGWPVAMSYIQSMEQTLECYAAQIAAREQLQPEHAGTVGTVRTSRTGRKP